MSTIGVIPGLIPSVYLSWTRVDTHRSLVWQQVWQYSKPDAYCPAAGLQWSDIDLEQGGLVVRRALQRQREAGLIFVEPKNRSSRRAVVLCNRACDALAEHLDRQQDIERVLGPRWRKSDSVFTRALGGPLDPSDCYTPVDDQFDSALAALLTSYS